MIKLIRLLPFLFLALGVLLLAAPVVLAQEGSGDVTLPDTAAGGVDTLALFLAGLAGLLASAITDAIKRLPFLRDEEKTAISGPTADLVAVLVSVGSAYIVAYLSQLAGFLDESGLWQVILFSWPAAKGWFEVSSLRRSVASKEGPGPATQKHIARTVEDTLRRLTSQPKAAGKPISGIFPKDIEATLQRGGYFTVEELNAASDGDLASTGLAPGAISKIREMLAAGITVSSTKKK